jgi:hypothetical protein
VRCAIGHSERGDCWRLIGSPGNVCAPLPLLSAMARGCDDDALGGQGGSVAIVDWGGRGAVLNPIGFLGAWAPCAAERFGSVLAGKEACV